jgi:hypothetical protein
MLILQKARLIRPGKKVAKCKDRDNKVWKQPAVAITCSDRATSDLWKLKDMLPLTRESLCPGWLEKSVTSLLTIHMPSSRMIPAKPVATERNRGTFLQAVTYPIDSLV